MMNASAVHAPESPARPRRERFERWLHRIYFRSSGLHHSLYRRMRPAGVAVGIVFVLATCLGIGHARSSIYQLFSLSLAMLCISLPWALLRRASLAAVREAPRHATAGVTLRLALRVRNNGRRRVSRAWLAESPPDPRPDVVEFTSLREPGEEERNRFDRCFAYFRWQWLLLRRRLFSDGLSKDEINLAPGQQARVFIELTPARRGVIRLHDLRVLLPDPLGLFQKCVKVSAPPVSLTVLPRRYPLPPVRLPGGAAFRISGDANTNAIGTSGEFVGLRDYRSGDPLRQIHWKSWARTGHPIVKELEDTFYPRYGLVLDTLSSDRNDDIFEDAVSVAASFAAEIDTSESLLDLMFIKNEAHIVTAGRGVERAEKLLEVLAAVTPSRRGDLKSLARLVLRHGEDLTSCVVILNGWDDLRADLLRSLAVGGVVCVPIVIGRGARPDHMPGYWLECGHIARDLRRLPGNL
jgi:uncharacterized protein (DUF58 family)